MEIYVYRHALADFGADHENPPLSKDGEKQAGEVTRHAREFGFKPTHIVSSPLIRAKQTAEIAKKNAGLESRIIEDECLYGGKKPSEVYEFLKGFKKTDRIVLVTHQPLIDHLIADLIKGEKANIQMVNGAIAGIEIKSKAGKGKGTLIWLAVPPPVAA
jgi:phosphohistidine phosphatase